MHDASTLRDLTSKILNDGEGRLFARCTGVLATLILVVLLYSAYCTFSSKLWSLFDYGVYTNMVWNCGHGNLFKCLVDRSYLTTHLSFSLALLGPFFRIWDHPLLLMVLQWVGFACGFLLIWKAARRHRLRPDVTAALLFFAVAYPFTQSVMLSSFHGVSLYLLLLPWLYHCLCFRKSFVAVPMVLLLGLREDAFLFAVPFLVYFAVRDRWRTGWLLAAASVIYGLVAILVIFPAISGMTLLERRGEIPLGEVGHWLSRDGIALRLLPAFWFLLPTIFFWRRGGAPLLVFAGLPFLVCMISADDRQASLSNHYPATVMAGLILGLLESMARDRQTHRRFHKPLTAVLLVVVTLVAHLGNGFLWFGRQNSTHMVKPRALGPSVLKAASHIPREGILLCPFRWGGVCGNRENILSWRQYNDARHHIDTAFVNLRDISGRHADVYKQWLSSGAFGVSFFEHDYVIMRRGYASRRNAAVLAAAELVSRTIQLERTHRHGGANREYDDGIVARYWPGKSGDGSVVVAFGKGHMLAVGSYVAEFHIQAEQSNAGEGKNWGRLGLHKLHEEEEIVAIEVYPRATDGWHTQRLVFRLERPTVVEPRVAGENAPLWLDRVVFVSTPGEAMLTPSESE